MLQNIDISHYYNILLFCITAFPIIGGMMRWLHCVYLELKSLRKELIPNGGSSLRDAINRIEDNIKSLEFAQHASWDFCDIPIFRANKDGLCTWANEPYLKLVKRPIEQVIGNGWISCVEHSVRDDVAQEWADCCKYNRYFDMTFNFIDVNQNVIHCRVRANGSNKTGYIGFIYIIP